MAHRAAMGMACLASAIFVASCQPGRTIAEDVAGRFVEAVQNEDAKTLYCLFAGAAEGGSSREQFQAWFQGRLQAYLEGRDQGTVELTDDGVALVKIFALGKGTYYQFEKGVRTREGTLTADFLVRFAYAEVNLSGLTPGTIFYLATAPPGRVLSVQVPEGRGTVTEEVLDTIRIRLTLTHAPARGGCPEGWKVASLVPVPGTGTSTRVTWYF